MMLIGDRNHRLVEAQAPTASSSSAAPSDVTAIGAAVDDEPSSSATSTRESTPTSSGSTKNAMKQRHPASSRSRVQRPTTTTSSRRKPTSFANIVIASLAIVYITICGQSSQAALLQGCNFDESLCDQGEICIPDGLFGQCYSDEESELLKPLVVNRPLDAFQQELLRLELTRLANNALNWPHARSQCVLAYFKLTVVYALDYDTEFCSARNPNNIWALIQEVQNVLATEREEAAKQELLRQTFLHNGVQVVGNDNVAAASDNSELSGGDNAEDFRAIFLKLRQPVGDAVAEEETADGAAEEPPLTNADDGAGNGEEQQQQQLLLLQQRQVKRSIDGNDDEDQQQQQQQQPFENQQMPVALEEDVDGSAAVIPQRVVELDTRDGQPVPASVDVSAKPTTPLSVELPTLDDAARNAIPQLEKADEQSVDAYVDDVLHNREPHLRALNERQFQKLAVFVNQMRDILLSAVDSAAIKALNSENDGADVGGAADPANNDSVSAPEVEEVVPLTSANNQQQLLLKKDAETFHNDDMGLSKTVHKIVKGGVERVEGYRVYLKVLDDKSLDETELYRLINYLDRQIAQPNQLYFDEFKYADGQLSFRISRLRFVNDLNQLFSDAAQSDDDEAAVAAKETDAKEGGGGGKQPPIIDNASGVAEAVYKRRKDIQTLSGVEVDETGIGSGENIVPVESAKHEWFFVPVVAVCAFTILSLIGVLAVQLFRRDGRARCGRGAGGGADDASSRIAKALQNANLPEVIDHYEGKPSSIYQDLCRQRMLASQDMPVGVSVVGGERRATLSKHSSTSSWPDESVLQSSNLDISTGHVIMAFLKEYLEKPDEIAAQWGQLSGYENANACTSIGARAENASKNLDGSVLPYDDSLVTLQQPQHNNNNNNTADATIVTVTTDAEAPRYVNATRIYDADPRQVAYIAAQSPCAESVVDFWQMVWEQGVVLVVNLCEASELRDHASRMAKYWPDEGAKVFGTFEINLVSEHIWSEDYVVRSLYLKNLATRETRTVTQFHYLTWPAGGVPHSIKSLLEFRRKVNKSYRGHASPVLIHCTNGSGRTGTYCLIDVVMNRILKGIKELNVAGSLEHLRDQRAKMVENQAQYTFVFQCVAEEVSSLLKNLQH